LIEPARLPLDQAEARAMVAALGKHDDNRRKTVDHLGINKTTLWRKMKKYRINYPPADETL
jgi:transcriptional regulator with PAS, ATPase and Fis domain